MLKKYWIKCPICNGKTRVQVFHNTVLKDFPLSALNANLTHIIDVEKLEIVIKIQKNKLLLFRRKDIKMKRLPKYTPAEVRMIDTDLLTKKCRKLLARIKQKPYMKNYISNYHAKKIYQCW